MDVDRARARALGLCYRCKKPGHVARDCQEKNFKDVIRGLNVADLKEIANIVAGTSTLTELVETQEEEDEDFSVPHVRLVLVSLDTAERIDGRALLDSGCTSSSIDRKFVRRKQLTTQPTSGIGAGSTLDPF
ncbi:hypothetical protein AURDEDRAFT_177944 [Auricularia subglabra TFB-10046 SS5]|uniref:CCHC-type domain-containing protein n=1 Tax=Auricularia subglabra (strain TFB-10046 / SS5) TaxID=717982 RepID=J0L9E0_AURST|nr:hypothetical protein AURDEDRAFT_177944 [Auricularia subglabra TFB-10046 SS5]